MTLQGNGNAIITKPPVFKGKTPPKPVPVDKGVLAAQWAMLFLNSLRGKLIYSESPDRAELYDRVKAMLAKGRSQAFIIANLAANPPDADCSQFVATCNMAAGFPKYNDHDYTGTEFEEGIDVTAHPLSWLIGDDVVFGAGTGVHTGKLVAPAPNGDWYVVDFGEQGAPNHTLLSVLKQWFAADGHPGIRVLRPA